jgi:hypothetical protein
MEESCHCVLGYVEDNRERLTISLLCPLIDIVTISVLLGLFFELCGSL